jgi:hypothetical protein
MKQLLPPSRGMPAKKDTQERAAARSSLSFSRRARCQTSRRSDARAVSAVNSPKERSPAPLWGAQGFSGLLNEEA